MILLAVALVLLALFLTTEPGIVIGFALLVIGLGVVGLVLLAQGSLVGVLIWTCLAIWVYHLRQDEGLI